MKSITFLFAILFPFAVFSQQNSPTGQKNAKEDHSIRLGIRGGLNFANVTNASSINSKSQTGYHIGLFLAPPSKSVLASRSEITFSRQGYNNKTSTNTGSVELDY